MILMVLKKDEKVYFDFIKSRIDEKHRKLMKIKDYEQFLFAVFTYTVLHGGDHLIMKEGLELG